MANGKKCSKRSYTFLPMSVEESAETWLGGRIEGGYSNQAFHAKECSYCLRPTKLCPSLVE